MKTKLTPKAHKRVATIAKAKQKQWNQTPNKKNNFLETLAEKKGK